MDTPILRRLFQVTLVTVMQGTLLFAAASQLDWLAAWVYLGLNFSSVVAISLVMLRHAPGLIAERSQVKADAKVWDRLLVKAIYILGLGSMLLVAGLDQRYSWSPSLPVGIQLLGLLLVVAGICLLSWAMLTNRFFSTVVRIQRERQHVLVSAGPYSYVRHPGYGGLLLFALATPLLLGSLWAFIAGLFSAGLIVIRTLLEDKTLMAELEGYEGYALRVRHRLIPGVW
ncbi:MAG: isoprenylcysteine carboxylmethyltransferase family protein [Anaerolineales bacterium]|nr:isoprenylcysteine carboxylmethyltransferase family protein [Anaerolineales bacterium]